MELNSSVNTFIGGMNLDSDISLLKENQYTYAENIRLLANDDSTTGILQNRDCLNKIESSITGTILGTVVTRLYNEVTGKSEEVIVVITLDNDLNNIYIINTIDYSSKIIIDKQPLGWDSKLKIVANYESDTVSKIYVTDGKSQIKILNLTTLEPSKQYSSDMFELLPNVTLQKPQLTSMIDGKLKSGAVAYAYQLFQKNGAESSISPISGIINIPKTKGNDNKSVLGGNYTDVSQYGCSIKIDIDKSIRFDYARIYRIRYNANNDVANIFIVLETTIVNNTVYYLDISDDFISQITVDEFNMLTATEFVANTIEKHENRLFAAGIKEQTWPTDYDARAYRCDRYGNIELHASDSTTNISGKLLPNGTIDNLDVPVTHDCINPSNQIIFGRDSFTYAYYPNEDANGNITYKLGGIGKNIQYEFCYTKVLLSDNPVKKFDNWGYPSSDFTLTFGSSVKKDPVNIVNQDGDILLTKNVPEKGIIRNYADSWFTTNFLGYQRDEIYRFGIVFYDKKHRKSPVYWIGDIRMPSTAMLESNDDFNKISPFHFGEDDIESMGYALGVKFKVKSLIEGAVRYEIVRCARTETDRTIVAQGALSNIILFDSWGLNDKNLGLNDIRPMSLLNCSDKYYVDRNGSENSFKPVENYFEFISPEICISKTSILDNLKNGILCNVLAYSCMQYSSDLANPNLALYSQWGTRQLKIYTLDIENPYGVTSTDCGNYDRYTENINNVEVQYPSLIHGWAGGIGSVGEKGLALLLKYFRTWVRGQFMLQQYTVDDVIVVEPLPYIRTADEVKNYSKAIGNKLYVNTTIGADEYMNNHGITSVLKTSNGSKNLWFLIDPSEYSVMPPFTAMDATWVCNIKQQIIPYSGNKYANRVNSTYVNCVNHNVDDTTVCVFGGDTYLAVFDYTHTTIAQETNDSNKDQYENMFINCYIPLETSVNLDLLSSNTYNKLVEKASNSSTEDMGLGQNLIQYEPTVTPNYTQTKPLYEYNSAYSADNNAQLFVPNLLYTDENPVFETRIISSELKTNNEIVDSWTKFKFANYLDADNQYGPVTNLKSFNGKLFFWQDSAVGIASVNERSLIQDNNINMLTLGTGGILVRYDYHTTLNGSSISNDRSICNSSSTLYWYDTDKHEICAINNTVIELSKVKGVKSWCNKLLGRSETLGWYDWKYNEVLFLNKSEDVKRSIVFNEQLNTFTGFYTYPASHVALMVDKLVTLDEMGNIYTHDSDVNYEPFESKITYVVNKGYPETKVFDNVWFDAEFFNTNVLSYILFKTKTLETDLICYCDIENREDTYRFPIPRDKNGVARMRGKYLICDYTFDCTNDGDFKIPYIKTTFRISRV